MARGANRGARMPSAELTLAALTEWGEALGARLAAPCVITLEGDLGAGKTTLVQAICRGYGVTDAVTSPTFALVHVYHAAQKQSPVYHLDLYRLDGPHQLANIGWDDALASNAIVLIEWPERAGEELPPVTHDIKLSHVADNPGVRKLIW
jgi:tRNA threonylcarbamoyladenosine biosynthesis protein TsaE